MNLATIPRKVKKVLKQEVSLRKAINHVLVSLSYAIRSSKVYGYPTSLRIEPTNICNLKCPLCPTGNDSLTRPKGFMTLENFKKIIDELHPYLFTMAFWNYGESLMKDEFYSMIKYAKTKNIHVTASTNGHFFTSDKQVKLLIDSELDILIISMDGATPQSYKKYRVNGDFNKVISGLKRVVNMKRKLNSKIPYIQLQFIVMKQNEHEIRVIQKLADEIGVDELQLKTLNLTMDYGEKQPATEESKQFLPNDEKYSRYSEERNIKLKKNINKLKCPSLYFGSVVNWDGTVSPCCWDANATVTFGNCFTESFSEIWNNKKYVTFRKMINKNKDKISLCKTCIPAENLLVD